jgi:hypothetical protein
MFFGLQGIYYYFYQLLKNKVENVAAARGKKGLGDGTVGIFSWLVIAAIAGLVIYLHGSSTHQALVFFEMRTEWAAQLSIAVCLRGHSGSANIIQQRLVPNNCACGSFEYDMNMFMEC